MRNITVSVDEETHRRVRARAAELDTSVSALVRDFLKRLVPRTRPGRLGTRSLRADESLCSGYAMGCHEDPPPQEVVLGKLQFYGDLLSNHVISWVV
ncbi:MAG: ribbon-helix-helix protein, CopG family [Gammaproteobacteria bacterium]|nr:ribbon-helix-helix protein, CopG family [Gammaproteobacteria bacterium]